MALTMTNAGFAELAGLAGNTGSCTAFTALGYGTGTTAKTASDTALETEVARAAATVTRSTTTVTNDTLSLTKTFTITGTATLSEIGVLNNATSGGTLLGSEVISPTRSVVSGDSWALTVAIKFSAA